MEIQIQSDLHIEMFDDYQKIPTIERKAPILCLLGDIGSAKTKRYERFLLEQASKFETVFVIAGNHEYYGLTIELGNWKINHICEQANNLHFLNNSSVIIDNTRFVGTTLWSNIPDHLLFSITKRIGDYHRIKNFSVFDSNKLHSENVQWISSEIQKAKNENQQVVILSHHAPIMKSASPMYVSKPSQHAYATALEHLFEEEECVKLWGFGHTHWCVDTTVGNTRIVSNCMGYNGENTNQKEPFFTVSI